jgi:Glycosyl hydrolase family 20, catalytic domain
MVDAARLPEAVSYYRRLIDFCHEWELNALLVRLTDDQGAALRFQSHPELITHRHALTLEDARDLAAYGEQRGVTLIPEVESFGHTRYITAVPRYEHLEDRDPGGPAGFTGLNPVAPDTLALIGDLYRDVAGAFPSRYLHGGCDEVNWGGSERSRRALEGRSRARIVADYINGLNEICQGLGRELIVWGDVVLHREPDIAPRLKKSVIVMDWQYLATDPRAIARVADRAIAHGLRVIGAPAMISCAWGPRAGHQQLRNVDAFADAYAGIGDPRCLGVTVTNWIPSRYLQRSLWDHFAYAAVALHRGSAAARRSGFRSFVERFYGTGWNSAWRAIFDTYYRIAPHRPSCAPGLPGPRLPVPWASEVDLRGAPGAGTIDASPYARLHARLLSVGQSVQKNQGDFSALALSAEYLAHAFWRQAAVEQAREERTLRPAAGLLETIAERDRTMAEKLDADWNAGRFSDSPGKLEAAPGLEPADQLLFRMRQAAEFSAELARDGDRARRILRRIGNIKPRP